jgi:hypothetical protein
MNAVRVGLAALALVLAIVAAGLRLKWFTAIGGVRLNADWAMVDFRDAIYFPIQALLSGARSLYPEAEGFAPYPPFILLLHFPLGLLPLGLAEVLFGALTIGVTLLLGCLALRAVGRDATPAAVLTLGAVLLLSRPGQWNLLLGQTTAELAAGSYLAIFWGRRSPWLGGIGLTLAMLKPTWGIPLAVLMLASREVRPVLLGGLLTAVVNLPVLAVLVYRNGGLHAFLDQVLGGYRRWTALNYISPATSNVRIDAASTLSRFLGHPMSDVAQIGLTLLVLAVAAVAVRLIEDSRTPAARPLAAGIICSAILLSGYHMGYDLLILTAPALAIVYRCLPGVMTNRVRLVFLGLYGIVAMNWLATDSVIAALRPHHGLWLLIASLNGFVVLALFCGYLALSARLLVGAAVTSAPGSVGLSGASEPL